MTPDWFLLALLTLTAYRLWRLLGADDITQPFRDRLPGKARELVECAHCAGTWIAFVVVGVYHLAYGLPRPVLWYLATATLVGLLNRAD